MMNPLRSEFQQVGQGVVGMTINTTALKNPNL
jgi:hypothetical protein